MALNIKRIKVTIAGKTPLLMHRFTDAAAMQATKGNRINGNGDHGTPREQAEMSIYYDLDGETVVIPQPNLFRCLIDAGKYFKIGRSKVTTQKSSLVPACVEVEGTVLPLEHEEPWDVDTRPVRIPATGGRILRHRPRFDEWSLTFIAGIDTDMMGVQLFRDLVDAAGSRIGLGDFRPDCKGPYGKFQVTAWEVEE